MSSRNNISRLLTLVACAAALAIAGCGSDEEGTQLPADASQALRAQLQSIQNRIDDGSVGACRDILEGEQANTDPVSRILDGLPEDVDEDLSDATRASFVRLFELVEQECTSLEDQTDTETTPTETETVPTETVPTDTETETTPTETVPLEPPAGNNGNGKEKKKDKGNKGSQGGGQVAPGDE